MHVEVINMQFKNDSWVLAMPIWRDGWDGEMISLCLTLHIIGSDGKAAMCKLQGCCCM